MIVVQGDVNLTGNSVIGIGALNGVVKVGKYPLIKYGGNLRKRKRSHRAGNHRHSEFGIGWTLHVNRPRDHGPEQCTRRIGFGGR